MRCDPLPPHLVPPSLRTMRWFGQECLRRAFRAAKPRKRGRPRTDEVRDPPENPERWFKQARYAFGCAARLLAVTREHARAGGHL